MLAKSENPQIIHHCPLPQKSGKFFSLFAETLWLELFLFFIQSHERHAVWLEDPFKLSTSFEVAVN
jgi:hypothetical protein